jgi:hypothetical protein
MFLCFSRDISIRVNVRLTENNSIIFFAFNLKSDKSFSIYIIICYFNLCFKTSYVSRLYLVKNVVTKDKKLDVKYLLYS